MIAAKGLIDERENILRGVEEKRVEITADETVEGCKLCGRKLLDTTRRYIFILQTGDD